MINKLLIYKTLTLLRVFPSELNEKDMLMIWFIIINKNYNLLAQLYYLFQENLLSSFF